MDEFRLEEHAQVVHEILSEAEREFANDDLVRGSRKLWEASAYVVAEAAKRRGWEYEGRRALWLAVRRLASERDDHLMAAQYIVPLRFSRIRERYEMEDWELEMEKPMVYDFVERVLKRI